MTWVCERTIPNDRQLSAKLLPTFGRGVMRSQSSGSPTAVVSVF
jgi:hypothetical protein